MIADLAARRQFENKSVLDALPTAIRPAPFATIVWAVPLQDLSPKHRIAANREFLEREI